MVCALFWCFFALVVIYYLRGMRIRRHQVSQLPPVNKLGEDDDTEKGSDFIRVDAGGKLQTR